MSIKSSFLIVFICSFSFYAFSQDTDSLQGAPTINEVKQKWHTSPSLKWNITALANIFVPATSFTFELPFNEKVGMEIEAGPLLSGPHFRKLFIGEEFSGYRFRAGPKLYLLEKNGVNPFYLQAIFKYDRGKSFKFREFLDLSQSFQEIIRVEENFESIGGIFYGGYMGALANRRFIIDFSVGLGFNIWKEEAVIPPNRTFINQPRTVSRNLGESLAIFSLNFQLGYRFGPPVPQ